MIWHYEARLHWLRWVTTMTNAISTINQCNRSNWPTQSAQSTVQVVALLSIFWETKTIKILSDLRCASTATASQRSLNVSECENLSFLRLWLQTAMTKHFSCNGPNCWWFWQNGLICTRKQHRQVLQEDKIHLNLSLADPNIMLGMSETQVQCVSP